MPSPESNRRNARKSTGPLTRSGKATSRLNRLLHGAFSNRILPGEDGKAYRALLNSFRRHYKPADVRQELLVLRLASTYWRLLRLEAMEGPFLRAHQQSRRGQGIYNHFLLAEAPPAPPHAQHEEIPEAEPPSEWLPDAWVRDTERGNAIFKMARYQTWLERSFYRALHELESLRHSSSQPK